MACLEAHRVARSVDRPGHTSRTWPLGPCEAAFVSKALVACNRPLSAWRGGPGQPRVVFTPMKSFAGAVPFDVPCGRCMGCRLMKSSDWATRMIHESKLHDENSFVTLTYADAHLPADGSVSKHAVQAFNHRLRTRLRDLGRPPIRFFACGEYGSQQGRPHYHLIIFGFFPWDAKKWRQVDGNLTYRSAFLEEVWPYGHVEVGAVTHDSCGYVARYSMKKLAGPRSASNLPIRLHPITGQPFEVMPEFGLMSRRPGIGSGWFDQYHRDAFPSDFLIVKGKRVPVPIFYKNKLKELEQIDLSNRRKRSALDPKGPDRDRQDLPMHMRKRDYSEARRMDKDTIQELRAKQLKRDRAE